MNTILNLGELLVHGELDTARETLKGWQNGTGTTNTTTPSVGVTPTMSTTVSQVESRDDVGGIRREWTSYSRSIGTESTNSISLFHADSSMSKDNAHDDLLASMSLSDYSESTCTGSDLSNIVFPDVCVKLKSDNKAARMRSDFTQDVLERVTSEGSESVWSVRQLPEEVPLRRDPSFLSQCGEELCLEQQPCSEVVNESGKKSTIKPSKGNRMSMQMERAKKVSKGSVKFSAAIDDKDCYSTYSCAARSRASATNIDACTITTATSLKTESSLPEKREPTRKSIGLFKKTKPSNKSIPKTSMIRGAFFARNLQNKSDSTAKLGGSAPRATSPASTHAASLASIGQIGTTAIEMTLPSPSGSTFDPEVIEKQLAADDKPECSELNTSTNSSSYDKGKLSMSTGDDNAVDKGAPSTASGGRATPGETICSWFESAAEAVSPRNLLGDKWKVAETAKENTFEVILNGMCDRDKEGCMALECAEETVAMNEHSNLCEMQSSTPVPTEDSHSETKEVANMKQEKAPKWFAMQMSKFTKSKAEKKSKAEEDILMALILDEINLEKEKLKLEKDKLSNGATECTADDETVDVSDNYYDLPQGFTDLIANEIAEEFGVCGLKADNKSKDVVHTLLHAHER
ncbi:hypothetical protein ACHAWU_005334 [Discostella pseudostelligera]|uniref:Uncharacterized protein n=1 Tax=Discostella pseudostelligera TaxID=259834 RepID=A0ABD3NA90_9STRA